MTDLEAAVRALAEERLRELLAPVLARVELAQEDGGERLLSVASVAERTDVSERTVRRWLADGLIPTVTVAGRVAGKEMLRVRSRDLDAWIRGLPAARRGDERHERSRGADLRRRVAAAERRGAGQQPAPNGLLAEIEKYRATKKRGPSRRRSGAAGAGTA